MIHGTVFTELVLWIFCHVAFSTLNWNAHGTVYLRCKNKELSEKFLTSNTNTKLVTAWLIDARFLSYCLDQYGTMDLHNQSSCTSYSCQECMKPCMKDKFVDKDTCNKTACAGSSKVCEEACQFYIESYNIGKEDNRSSASLTSPPSKSGFATPVEMELGWPSRSGPNVTMYALIREDRDVLTPLLMTTQHKANVTANNACGNDRVRDFEEKKFVFMVVPVNQFGWRNNLTESPRSPPIEFPKAQGPRDLKIDDTLTYGEDIIGSPVLLLNVTWRPSETPGVIFYRYTRHTPTCSSSGVLLEHSVAATQVTVEISNPDDFLKGCTIGIKVVPVVECIRGLVEEATVKYEGCHVVKGYPESKCAKPRPTAGPLDVNITMEYLYRNCTEKKFFNCSSPGVEELQTCWNCSAIEAGVYFAWTVSPAQLPLVTGFEQVLGDLFLLIMGKKYYKPIERSTSGRDKNSTTYIIKKPGYYKFQVLLILSGAKDTRGINVLPGKEFEIELPVNIYPTQKPAPTHPGRLVDSDKPSALTVGLITLVVVLCCLIICLFGVWYTRKRRRVRFPNVDITKVRMEKFKPPDSWELHPSYIKLGKVIGEGAFGKVYLANVQESNVPVDDWKLLYVSSIYDQPKETKGVSYEAAVKLLRSGASPQERADFLAEIQLMKEIGYHKNVLCLTGCCTINEPLCLVTEYMCYGDLLHFMRNRRWRLNGNVISGTDCFPPEYSDGKMEMVSRSSNLHLIGEPSADGAMDETVSKEKAIHEAEYRGANCDPYADQLLPEDVLSFGWQIAAGMEYLTEKSVVHRDLAARNVLIGCGKVCKVADFGLARDIACEQVYMSRKSRKLPIKWMSLEAILCQEFTTKSDVWAFGVVLFEIVTLGGTPYPAIDNHALLNKLKSGYRMEQPENCADELYDIMQECWKEEPSKRPTFSDLRLTLEQLICQGTPYVSFNVNESSPYYNVPSFRSIDADDVSLSNLNFEADASVSHKTAVETNRDKEDGKFCDKFLVNPSDPCARAGMDNHGFERYVSSRHQIELSL